MNESHQVWRRLITTARRAPASRPDEMPFGFDSRVVSAWHDRAAAEETLPWNSLLRGALACSAAIMLLALLANFWMTRAADPNELAIADSVVTFSLLQSQ